jgi:hypothetical protein
MYEGKSLGEIDRGRVARSALAGLIGHGPLSHFWYEVSEWFFTATLGWTAWWAFVPKVRHAHMKGEATAMNRAAPELLHRDEYMYMNSRSLLVSAPAGGGGRGRERGPWGWESRLLVSENGVYSLLPRSAL